METRLLMHRPDTGWSDPLPTVMDSPGTLVAVFAAPDYGDRPDFWADLGRAFASSHVIACSGAGAIRGGEVVDGGAVAAVVRFERVTLASTVSPIQAIETSRHTGLKLGRALAPTAPVVVIVLSDGLQVNGTELLLGLGEALPPGTRVVGGLAADSEHCPRAWTLVEGVPRSGWVTAVALSGPLEVGTGIRSGWQAFGPERQVTLAERNILYELDGRPALALYREHLGEIAAELPDAAVHYPLAVRMEGRHDEVVRTVLAVDEREQTMIFAGEVPQGSTARMMRATQERVIEGAAFAGAEAVGMGSDPVLALAISCVSRRRVLGERCDEELAAAYEATPPGSLMLGFYSYGEISPSGERPCDLHNQTMSVTTFREAVA